jgi:hypothetical protein
MKETYVYISMPFIMLLFCFVPPSQANQSPSSTCVKCHTDDATLKTLFIPPSIPVSEGEG